MQVNSKLKKKAFCEPKNTEYCPPLVLATQFVLPLTGKWSLERKEADGGLRPRVVCVGCVHPRALCRGECLTRYGSVVFDGFCEHCEVVQPDATPTQIRHGLRIQASVDRGRGQECNFMHLSSSEVMVSRSQVQGGGGRVISGGYSFGGESSL